MKNILQKAPQTVPLVSQQNICAIYRKGSLKDRLFTTVLPDFTVDGVCNISNNYRSPKILRKHWYFYTKEFINLLYFEKRLALSIANIFWNIQFLPHFYYFLQWVRVVIFQINTNFLINKLKKYFYTKKLALLLHTIRKLTLSIAEYFRNTHFLQHFY